MILFLFFLFFAGLIFGSFVSALSWRMPKGISIAKGRSICPKCKHQITWYDNIPLVSYVILRGKCRNCRKHISLRYPLIELSSGTGFVLIYLFSDIQDPILYVLAAIIFLVLLIIFVIDLEHQIIPDSLVFTGVAVSFLYYLFYNPGTLSSSLLSGFAAASFLLVIHLVTKGRGMGLGDVKFAIFGGMVVGMKLLPTWLFLSFLTGAIAGIILILTGKAKLKTKIAFGPFLIVGMALVLVLDKNLSPLINFFI